MNLFFNHHLSALPEVIRMMRASGRVRIIASDQRPGHPVSGVADVFIPEPATDRYRMPAWYPDWLLSAARETQAGVVIAYRHRVELSAFQDRFRALGITLMCGGDETSVRLIEDKTAFLRRAAGMGLPISEFIPFRGAPGFREAVRDIRGCGETGPLCVKPATGIYGAGFRVLISDDEASSLSPAAMSRALIRYEEYERLLDLSGDLSEMMLMPLLPGPERSLDMVCMNGRLLGSVARLKGSFHQIVGPDPYLHDMASSLCSSLNLTGLINMQTMEDGAGQQRILEMNARMSGGVAVASRKVVRLFLEQLRFECVPFLHGLQWRLAAEG